MRACVIFNPAAGRRHARRRLARFRDEWKSRVEFWPTDSRGHAAQLARSASEQGFAIVGAAGGDGTVHEVANGLLQAGRDDVTLAVVPIGSGNDYAYSLMRQFGRSLLDDDIATRVDVGAVTASDGRERFFVESLGLGLSAHVTLESRRVSGLQGKALYALAVYRAVRNYVSSELTIKYDDEPPWCGPIMMLSAMLGSREGSFSLAPHARLDDGLFDVVAAAPMAPRQVLGMLPRIALAGLPERHRHIARRRCRTITVQAATPLVAHTDGEMLCTAGDRVFELTMRVLPARLRVKVCAP